MIPQVSVITPTWGRHERLLNRCIPSVQAQTHRKVEHVIVSDGPDPQLAEKIAERMPSFYHPVTFIELPGPHPGGNRYGGAARRAGIEVAAGDLIAYIDDDDALRPGHCALLAAALGRNPEAGFAYSWMESHSHGGVAAHIGAGTIVPQCGQIGTPMIMHRRGTLEHGTWGEPSSTEDWELVSRWLDAGVPFERVEEATSDVWPSAYWTA